MQFPCKHFKHRNNIVGIATFWGAAESSGTRIACDLWLMRRVRLTWPWPGLVLWTGLRLVISGVGPIGVRIGWVGAQRAVGVLFIAAVRPGGDGLVCRLLSSVRLRRCFILAWSGFVDPADEFGSELLTHVMAHEFEGTDIVQNHPLRASARILLFSERLFRVTPRRRRPLHLGGRVRAARQADRAEGREPSWLLRSHEHQVTSNFILI